jgi:hypothetical protein
MEVRGGPHLMDGILCAALPAGSHQQPWLCQLREEGGEWGARETVVRTSLGVGVWGGRRSGKNSGSE